MPVRRVRRIIRKIDPWTVLKVSLIFNSLLALAGVLGSVVFWSIFVNAGIPDKISEIAEQLTLTFNADGPTYFRVIVLLAVMWTVLATGFLTLGALLYNLIADIVGGVEVVVLEETLVAPPMPVSSAGRKVRPAQRPSVTMEPIPPRAVAARPAAKRSRLPKINLPRRSKEPSELPEPATAPKVPVAKAPAASPEPVPAATAEEHNVG